MLDRAADYARLADQGHTAAEIGRRRRKSPGHVSILLRLGRALATLPEGERAALHSPRVTWRLVQRLVRTDVDPASLRKQLRDAVGGFSTHNVDARQRRRRRPPDEASTAGPAAPPGVAWGWDATWFADDPVGYATAHLAHLTHVHRVVAERAEHAARTRAAATAGIDAGQSLRGLQRRLRQIAELGVEADPAALAPTGAERRALAAFAILGRALADATATIAALDVGATRPPAAGAPAPGPNTAPQTATLDEIAADLDEP